METQDSLTAHQRSALVLYHLGVLRKQMTTREVAHLVNVTERGALYIMHKISGTHGVPLVCVQGQWYIRRD